MSRKSSKPFQADLVENDFLALTHADLHKLRQLF